MDTVGAVVGPVLAFAMLAAAPGAYDAVFVRASRWRWSASPSSRSSSENRTGAPGPRGAWLHARGRVRAAFASRRFRALVVAGGVLGLLTASDALIYLLLQRRGAVPTTFFPLLFVGTASRLPVPRPPVGRLADRWGRHRVFLAGHVLVSSASTCF